MVLPPSLEPDSVFKTISSSREAIANRLKNGDNRLDTTPAFYHGTPDPENLPNDRASIWLELTEIGNSDDRPFTAEILTASWTIFVVVRDQGSERFGIDPDLGDRIAGSVIEMLTSNGDDVSLDGAVESMSFIGAFHSSGSISGGDDLVQSWQMNFTATHPLWPIRGC